MASPAVAEDSAKKSQENACHVHEKIMVTSGSDSNIIVSDPTMINKQITKGVVRAKLNKRRHLVIPGAISSSYLDELMPPIVTDLFQPQTVSYNGGIANIKEWKISCNGK